MWLHVRLVPGLPDYRRRALALVLGTYPGVLDCEIVERDMSVQFSARLLAERHHPGAYSADGEEEAERHRRRQ